MRHLPDIVAVDLFCGVGGLTCGLRQAEIGVRAGFDVDESCEFAYEKNNEGAEFFPKDIAEMSAKDILPHFAGAEFTALVGCAPCQPFSMLRENRREKGRVQSDERWGLLNDFAKLVRKTKPDIVSMENVPGLRRQPVYADFIRTLQECGYHADGDFGGIVNCADYGVPQARKRLVVLASRRGKIKLLPPSHREHGLAGECFDKMRGKSERDDPAHISYNLTATNKKRIKASKPGGSWRDWRKGLAVPCHGERGHNFTSPYGRMSNDAPAPTITTQFCFYSCGRFGHPDEDRAITVREGALLQSFPADYEFFAAGVRPRINKLARHIGNAVPPALGYAIGESIVSHLRQFTKGKE